jgi:hypothetical protein
MNHIKPSPLPLPLPLPLALYSRYSSLFSSSSRLFLPSLPTLASCLVLQSLASPCPFSSFSCRLPFTQSQRYSKFRPSSLLHGYVAQHDSDILGICNLPTENRADSSECYQQTVSPPVSQTCGGYDRFSGQAPRLMPCWHPPSRPGSRNGAESETRQDTERGRAGLMLRQTIWVAVLSCP